MIAPAQPDKQKFPATPETYAALKGAYEIAVAVDADSFTILIDDIDFEFNVAYAKYFIEFLAPHFE